MQKLYFLLFFNFSFAKNIDQTNQLNLFDFIDTQEEVKELQKIDVISIKEFFKNFKDKTKLFHNEKFFYYISNNIFYYLNIDTNKVEKIIIKEDLTSVFSCFFDGEILILSTINNIYTLDLLGEVKNKYICDQDLKMYPRTVVCKNDIIYVIGLDNKIYAFTLDYLNSFKINLLWVNNTLYDPTSLFKFNHIYHNEFIYTLLKNRVCIINQKTGKVLNDKYLKKHYDNMTIIDDTLVLSTNMSFCYICLKDFTAKETENLIFKNKEYIITNKNLIDGDLEYDGFYSYRLLDENFYFLYKRNNFGSKYLLIDEDGIKEDQLKKFNISYVFLYKNKLLLIDAVNKKLRVL